MWVFTLLIFPVGDNQLSYVNNYAFENLKLLDSLR